MFIALTILLAALVLAAVAYPIMARMGETPQAPATAAGQTATAIETLDELLAQRDAAFQALRDLHFDHQVGKVTDEDMVAFEANLKAAAADALRRLDEWETATDQDLDLEMELAIAARRSALETPGRLCPACGKPAAADDAFCASCGQPLTAVPAIPTAEPACTCPRCGRAYEPGDRFCGGCGQSLPETAHIATSS
jgi:hypothetical protein